MFGRLHPDRQGSGTHDIGADYLADTTADVHEDSSATAFALDVDLHPTSTSVYCTPAGVVVDETTTCTATVTDVEETGTKRLPTGNVSFAAAGTGTFTPAQYYFTPNQDGEQQLLGRPQLERRSTVRQSRLRRRSAALRQPRWLLHRCASGQRCGSAPAPTELSWLTERAEPLSA